MHPSIRMVERLETPGFRMVGFLETPWYSHGLILRFPPVLVWLDS